MFIVYDVYVIMIGMHASYFNMNSYNSLKAFNTYGLWKPSVRISFTLLGISITPIDHRYLPGSFYQVIAMPVAKLYLPPQAYPEHLSNGWPYNDNSIRTGW